MSGNHRQNIEQGVMPLQSPDRHLRALFEKYDRDHDGRISLSELRNVIESREYEHDIPEEMVRKIMQLADRDHSGYLDYDEFVEMIKHPQLESLFGHLLLRYVHNMIPHRPVLTTDMTDGQYEEEYSCSPPALGMIVISIIEIILFVCDLVEKGEMNAHTPVASYLIYNPHKRFEAWRYLTYMFVHIGIFHLIVNLAIQILLGIPLEMVHKSWRVALIYIAGVVAGSLGTSITDPGVFLAGASGGVYALITAHIATIIMNWAEMEYAIYQLLVFLIVTVCDVGTAIYNRYILQKDETIGYAAHFFGAVAGLLVGINLLRNLEVTKWEKYIWWISLITYIVLMGAAILFNVLYPSYFPVTRRDYK